MRCVVNEFACDAELTCAELDYLGPKEACFYFGLSASAGGTIACNSSGQRESHHTGWFAAYILPCVVSEVACDAELTCAELDYLGPKAACFYFRLSASAGGTIACAMRGPPIVCVTSSPQKTA